MKLPPATPRDQAYAAAGRYILLHRCDVLVALWDGQGARGPGGTSDVAAQARQRDLPLAWFHAENRRPGKQRPTALGEEQGKANFERFPDQESLRGEERG